MRIGVCHVVIRDTLDWERTSYDQLISPFIRETVRLWNRTFHLDYMACRARIKSIAYDAHSALPNVQVVEPSSASAVDLSTIQPEDVVLLCDDDDWYHPQLVARLERVERWRDCVVMWPDAVYGFFAPKQNIARPAGLPRVRMRDRPLHQTGAYSVIKTNNYALSGALLQRQPQLLRGLWGHGGAARYLQAERPRVMTLAEPLSVVNRHPCSQLVLGRIMQSVNGEDAALALWRLVKHWVNGHHPPVPPRYQWATMYIERVRSVFHEACILKPARQQFRLRVGNPWPAT